MGKSTRFDIFTIRPKLDFEMSPLQKILNNGEIVKYQPAVS